jgi:nucleotide-binding universal stress UspA family protein
VEVAPLEASPAEGLIELSRDAGLLVVGSRGRSDLKGRLLGSVSQQCVHHAPVAVVVVPSDQR